MTALAQVTAGSRILITDLNAYYNLLKGVSGSGETITLIYNAAPSLLFQPSSDPAAGTEALQIKNNAGTVQGSLTYDGKIKTADGTATLPAHRFQSEASGLYLSSAGVIGVAVSGAAANILFSASAISVGATPATAGAIRTANSVTYAGRNNGNTNNITAINVFSDDKVYFGDASIGEGTVIRAPSSKSVALDPSSNGNVDFAYPVVALGAGSNGTLGKVGGSGPATATQDSWLQIKVDGTTSWVPIWR